MTGWRIITGDAREQLQTLNAGSVQTCITSPPYFGLRDYGHDGQIGLEPTPDEFVRSLVAVFREVRRALRDDGTVWLNLGDSYVANGRYDDAYEAKREAPALNGGNREIAKVGTAPRKGIRGVNALKPKDLIGIPWMVAFALRADGWYLRSEIIWHKPNPMPESVTDRPTKAHEQVFLLSKGPRYFYDADAIREPASEEGVAREGRARSPHVAPGQSPNRREPSTGEWLTLGRNKRTVWTVATQPYSGAHFATFPPKLIEPCVLAGSSSQACAECGTPYERITERTPMIVRPTDKRAEWQATDDHARTQTDGTMLEPPTSRTIGFRPGCEHGDAGSVPSVILDPFSGAGTTGLVALRHDRSYIGIELNAEYAELARRRIRDDAPLLNTPAERPAA